jgi:esterase/lipase superfamily enzyme
MELSAKIVRASLWATLVWLLLLSPAMASEGETAATWVSAAVTVCGLGWLWRRTVHTADVYDVWYGTNRQTKISNTYDNEFSRQIHYGKCRVSIPKGHVFGSIGSSPFKRWLQRLLSRSDDSLRVVKLTPYTPTEFEHRLRSKLRHIDDQDRTILIYIHGYNVKFRDAAIRAAQIGFDLKVPGAMALFSWPSRGELGAYLQDADLVAASEAALVEFLRRIANAAGNARISLIAHSMGNLGLVRALNSALAHERLAGVRFGQIFLAAPDVDANLFRTLATVYPKCSEKTTLYVSSSDAALFASKWVHKNQRTGYSPPVLVIPGIDTIEATNVDVDWLGHGYYAAAAGVLYDMAILIRSNLSPNQRPGLLHARTELGHPYWMMRAQTR